jgi:hypothetical protein
MNGWSNGAGLVWPYGFQLSTRQVAPSYEMVIVLVVQTAV